MRNNPVIDIFNVFFKANRIKQDEERRQRFVGFGITSIIFSAVMVAFAVGAGFLMGALNGEGATLFIFIVVGFVACLAGVLVCFIGSLVRVIAQFSMNKKAIRWVALAVLIAATAASVALVLAIPGML